MWILAATRAESAATALSLAVLASCFLLAVYRPRRTDLEGTPHRVPLIAFLIAFGWLLINMGASLGESSAPEKQTFTIGEVWMECALQVGVIVIIASAYLFSRSGSEAVTPVAPPLDPPASEESESGSIPAASAPRRRMLPEDWMHHLGVGLTVGLAILLPTSLLGYLVAPERDPGDTHILLRTLVDKGWDYLFPIILAGAILAPIAEELMFRVIFQGWFADRVGKWAVPLTAGLFCLVHRTADQVLLLPLALSLGLLYEYRRSYLEVVAAHAAFNGANLFAAINVT
ncbi:hypothetical protein AYO47_09165 [Planctomyces sp. SCGC AG-212-M04]|nr:hypothetical protein AYO47_09165 [Planctomyces sp. SCGC AG-212-M04]